MSLGIKGFIPTSLIDWPGKITAIIFLPGCSFRCHYCYNPEFITSPHLIEDIKDEEIFGYLEKKKKWLDGVTILGGEPTIHNNFLKIVQAIKNVGLRTALHTNGTNPEILENIIKDELIDYFAMDIKSSISSYEKVVDVKVDSLVIKKSVEIIKNSKVDYEFRTTVVPGLVDLNEIIEIGKWLKGSKKYFIQQFKPGKTLDPQYEKVKPYHIPQLLEFKKAAEPFFETVEIRGI